LQGSWLTGLFGFFLPRLLFTNWNPAEPLVNFGICVL